MAVTSAVASSVTVSESDGGSNGGLGEDRGGDGGLGVDRGGNLSDNRGVVLDGDVGGALGDGGSGYHGGGGKNGSSSDAVSVSSVAPYGSSVDGSGRGGSDNSSHEGEDGKLINLEYWSE